VLPCVAAVVSRPAWRMLVLLIARYVSNLINEHYYYYYKQPPILTSGFYRDNAYMMSSCVRSSVCLSVCPSVRRSQGGMVP